MRRTKRNIMFDTIAARIKSMKDYTVTYRELSRLSSRELADIGLTRSVIRDVARGRGF
jgi:uncharacterized protein YjiS (DUF1127 family)